jgi:trigger factor
LNYSQNRSVRNQLIGALMSRVNFDLPASSVEHETRNVVFDLVRENQKRGVSRELIEQEKDKIYSAAAQNAKDRVKVSFLLQKIAEKENIKVSQEEVARRVQTMAAMYQIPPEKFIKDLQKRNGFVEIYDQLANEKVLEFLQQNAKIEEVPAGTLSQPQGNPA